MRTIDKVIILILAGLFLCCDSKKEPDNKLELQNRILDNAGLLTTEQGDSLFTLIENLELQIGSQIAVLTIVTLDGQKIEQFSFNTFEATGLGRSTHNDGVLITIANNDRMVRIEIGTGLENIIKDEIAARLIREDLAPKFREGKFGLGLYIVIEKITKLIVDNKEKVGQDPVWK